MAGLEFAQRTIAGFATEAAKLSQSTAANFETFVRGVKERSLELETQYRDKALELEGSFRNKQEALDAEHRTKLQEIEAKEKQHAEAVKQFELRNNTVVRRDLLKEIRSKIEQQRTIEISKGTIKKRLIVHGVCGLTLFIAVVLMGIFAYKLYNATAIEWRLLVPMTTSTALFVMTGIYYIRWNDQWFREHARVEFENRKFASDILRASWVAELFFEWADKKDRNMPPELVASFTRNLFEGADLDGRLHPADQLNDMIKQFSTLELGKNGIKVTRKDDPKS
jgi:cation transport ATPase